VRYRLGAEELIELGDSCGTPPSGRRPFLSDRRPRLGQLDILGSVGSFLSGSLEFSMTALADVVNLPLGLLSRGADALFTSLEAVLTEVPVIGVLASQILVVGNAILQFALSAPGKLLEGIADVFGSIKRALDARFSDSEQEDQRREAADKVVERAPEALRGAVRDVLGGTPPREAEAPAEEASGEAAAAEAPAGGGIPTWVPIAAAGAVALLLLA